MYDFRYMLILDADCCAPWTVVDVMSRLAIVNFSVVQLRVKSKVLCLKDVIKRLLDILRSYQTKLMVNDYLCCAHYDGVSGVHLGQEDGCVIKARNTLLPQKIIGLSISTQQQAMASLEAPVDYFGVGPVFSTKTKRCQNPPLGLKGLRHIARISRQPVVAIGGLHKDNLRSVIMHGASGVAIASSIIKSCNPLKVALEIRDIIEKELI